MNISFDSFLSTMIWTSLFCVLVFACRSSYFFITKLGVQSLLVACCLLLARLCIPLEIPFVKVVTLPQLLNPIKNFFHIQIYGFAILHISIIVWILVSSILLLRLLILYITRSQKLKKMPIMITNQIRKVTQQIIIDDKKIVVMLHQGIASPVIVYGKPNKILLPDMDYSDFELQVILQHEFTHYKNGDLYIQVFVELFCIAFWWNPLVYLLKYNLDNLLELRCDAKVMGKKAEKDIAQYAKVLIKFASLQSKKKPPFITSEFTSDKALIQRIKFLFHKTHKFQKLASAMVAIAFVAIWLASYLFSFQSQYVPPNNTKGTESTYISENGNSDGTYTITFEDGRTFAVSEETKQRITTQSDT